MSKLKLREILPLVVQYNGSPKSTKKGRKGLMTALYTMSKEGEVSTSVAKRFVLRVIKDL
jgi:hypothetical protein